MGLHGKNQRQMPPAAPSASFHFFQNGATWLKRRLETQDQEGKFGRQMLFIGRREHRRMLKTLQVALFGPEQKP